MSSATDAQKKEATDKYRAGMAAYGEKRYDEALELFRASYEAVKSPNSHLMTARTLARLDRIVEAHREFEEVKLEAEEAARTNSKYAPTAEAATAELQELDERLAFVRPIMAGSVEIAGEAVSPESWGEPIAVRPGSITVTWTPPNGETVEQSVTANAGETVDVALSPPAPKSEPVAAPVETAAAPMAEPSGIDQRKMGYVVGGIGVGGFALFGIFGALNNARHDDLTAACPDGICSRSLSEDAEQGRRFQAVANAGLGIGIAGVATGVILVLTAPSRPKRETASKIPKVALSSRSVSVSGRF